MKTRLMAFLFLILLPMFSALGQDRIDVVYLKNGDVLKGIIVENVPNDYVKIELPGGSVFTVKYADILKFTKEKPTSTEPQTRQQPTETVSQPDMQKMIYYENEKKNSGTAVVLSLLLTSTGHAYAGNWGRGLLFTLGRVSGVVIALTAGIQTTTDYWGYTDTQITAWYYIGFTTVLVFVIWEAIDASAEVDRYNANLYSKIMGKTPVSLDIVPSKNGPHLQLSYSF